MLYKGTLYIIPVVGNIIYYTVAHTCLYIYIYDEYLMDVDIKHYTAVNGTKTSVGKFYSETEPPTSIRGTISKTRVLCTIYSLYPQLPWYIPWYFYNIICIQYWYIPKCGQVYKKNTNLTQLKRTF